jgi:hypothetical protein
MDAGSFAWKILPEKTLDVGCRMFVAFRPFLLSAQKIK